LREFSIVLVTRLGIHVVVPVSFNAIKCTADNPLLLAQAIAVLLDFTAPGSTPAVARLSLNLGTQELDLYHVLLDALVA